ncbi:hypothetical protein ABT189_09440 [Streptomyces sp900105755]
MGTFTVKESLEAGVFGDPLASTVNPTATRDEQENWALDAMAIEIQLLG